jgi:hypothetical protein
MAAIKIDNLSVSGAEFFSDSESYLDELSESDVLTIKGGTWVTTIITVTLLLQGDTRQQ